MKAFLVTLLSLCITIGASAGQDNAIRVDGDVYRSGPVLYDYVKEKYGTLMPTTTGYRGFIDVPLDYGRLYKGLFKLSYHLPTGLDPAKPTVLFFYGGPGGTSLFYNLETRLPDFNVIYFDQRGTGFSHLPTLRDAQNPEYMSSEFIARDADALLRNLGVKKVSVWGHSYGTTVATIFAHLYAKKVSGLVLEGTIFDGSPNLWMAPHRLRILQRFFDRLPADMQKKILEVSASGNVNESWFARGAQSAMYDEDFESKYQEKIAALFKLEANEMCSKINSENTDAYLRIDSAFFGAYMFHQIACQELSWSDVESTWNARFVNGILTPAKDQKQESCLQIPGMASRLNRTYKSTHYPLDVPVTYLQGTIDGATTADGAIFHYKQTARKQAQIVLVKKSGHSPALHCMSAPIVTADCENVEAIADIVRSGLLGKELRSEQLLKAGSQWKYTKKNFPKAP